MKHLTQKLKANKQTAIEQFTFIKRMEFIVLSESAQSPPKKKNNLNSSRPIPLFRHHTKLK